MASNLIFGACCRNVFLMLFAHLVFLTPILYFGDGFFLRRMEFPDKSVETGKPVYNRAVILLVDALSYSFAQNFDNTPVGETNSHFINKLTVFTDLLDPNKSHIHQNVGLYKFVADPPTTTMQRIKALSTGSLSTFIEIAANFFSSEVAEDSWIYQSSTHGNGVVALGDDTWGGLFPGAFKRTHLLPSFNVKDLDTVDNGVLEHLYNELNADDWSVLLAHFLGVDHCGHTFGRNHPEMTRKLKQMDGVIRDVLQFIDNDTVLFVLGDHGMTPNGDHGGDSDLEMAATLFVYGPKHYFDNSDVKVKRTAFQTDFIPSISLLMGWPIPFSSIGSLMDDLFVDPNNFGASDLLRTYQRNSLQLSTYFEKYFSTKNTLPARSQLASLYKQAIVETDIAEGCLLEKKSNCHKLAENAVNAHKLFHQTVRSTCESTWVRFNLLLVFGGLLGACFGICVLLLAISQSDTISLSKALLGLSLICLPLCAIVMKVGMSIQLFESDLGYVLLLNGILLAEVFLFLRGAQRPNFANFKKYSDFAIFLLPVLIGKFSNSYVIYEPSVLVVVLALFSLIRIWRLVRVLLASNPGITFNDVLSWPLNFYFVVGIGLLLCLRVQLSFVSCREEHGPYCEQTSLLNPITALVIDEVHPSYLTIRFVLGIIGLFSVLIYFRHLAKSRGNLSGFSLLSQLYSPGLFFIATLVIGDWLLQAAVLQSKGRLNLPPSVRAIFPKTVYFIFGFVNLYLWISPMIYTQKSEKEIVAENFDPDEVNPANPAVVRSIFQMMKQKYESGNAGISSLYVYGIGSVISSAWQMFYALCFIVVVMLLGDGISPAVSIMALAILLCYKSEMSQVSAALALHLIQSLAFYSTGHQATWTHIKWQAAFVGFDQVPDFYAIPGTLILTNTFAGNIISVLAIPFFVLWPACEMNKQNKEEDGECYFISKPLALANSLLRIALLFVTSTAVEVIVSAVAACFLRRHLMAYKIFVPRLIFTILSFAFNTVLLILVVVLPLYVLLRLAAWRANPTGSIFKRK